MCQILTAVMKFLLMICCVLALAADVSGRKKNKNKGNNKVEQLVRNRQMFLIKLQY